MDRVKITLVCFWLGIMLASCNLPGQQALATAGSQDLPQEATEFPDITTPAPEQPSTTATIEMEEPSPGVEEPTREPPGEWLPAQDRMQAGDELTIHQITMIDAKVGWAIGGANGRADSVLRSIDGGESWKELSPPEPIDGDQPQRAAAAFLDGISAWIVYYPESDPRPDARYNLRVWLTSDAGQHWRLSSPISLEFLGSSHSPTWVHFSNQEQGWVLARYGGSGMHRYPVYLVRSDDAGAYWTILEDPFEGLWLQSCPKTGWDWHISGTGVVTVGFCPFESAEIHLTIDGGTTWETARLPFTQGEEERFDHASCEAHSPILFSEQELLLASDCPIWGDEPETIHLLYRTRDLGKTWQIQDYPGGQLYDIGEGVIFALSRDIFRSDDGGLTWTLIKQVAWDGQFSFINAQSGWAVARDEADIALVHTVDGAKTWQLIEPILIP